MIFPPVKPTHQVPHSAPARTVVQVALPLPLRRTFDYLPPANLPVTALQPGRRVQVPFGKKQLIGVVAGVIPHSSYGDDKLKTLTTLLDDEPALTPPILRLCQWATEYYQHAAGDVLATALPNQLRNSPESWDERTWRWQLTQKGRLIGLEQLGRAKRQQDAIRLLREHPDGLHQPLLSGLGVQPVVLRTLADKGLVEQHEDGNARAHWQQDRILAESPLTLNEEQQQALAQLDTTNDFRTFLLEGVTGSGKTEIYLQAITRCLQQGRQALVLVPEIGLTPQTLHRFQQRFAVPVASFHSNLTDRERLTSWRKARTGEAAIVIGTRSALFAPLEKPGLIIVDEEHDLSYKQQDGFRYNARDLAIMRGKIENIPVLLGSATPSLESLHNARSGRYVHLTLTQRAGNAQPPRFRVLDIRQKPLQHGMAPEMLEAMQHTLQAGQQVLVFINRRGYAPVLMCHDCGWFKECPHCDHRMTCHAHPAHLHCHHCNHQERIPRHCDHCKSTDLRPIGLGTERLEDNLIALFPKFPVIRIDRDTTQRKQAMAQHLERIRQGQPCILVGTQMLAKGHHFPRVTLVAICDMDAGLFAADFRATEQTAQLLMQVAGRSGRGDDRGMVLLQTHQPSHPLLQTLLADGYGRFATELLSERRLMGMPPFGYLALLRAESADPRQATHFLQQVSLWLQPQAQAAQVEIWGPAPALLPKKARRFRFQLLLRADQRTALHGLLKPLTQQLESTAGHQLRWSLDVDPVTLD
ncbi:MAG TPA: primosomal protein N' [Dongiaceae bacterium]|nr:primosomal protein N' [Dongiaceae bacterium]